MENIKMVDLKGQYQKIKHQVDQSIQEVIDQTAFINGAQVKNFQESLQNYLDVKHVIPCANGTDALQVALMSLGLEPNDEVITTDFTFAATVEVISLLKLKPVLVDIDPETFNIDVNALEEVISENTKAILPVHLFGRCANMEALITIAKKHQLYVIEDNAQAIGADCFFSDGTHKKAGTIGDIGTTSFFPSKNLGCFGDGGAIFTNDDRLAEVIRGVVNHGMYQRYHHDVVGVNSRLDSIQAAVLNAKLPYLDSYNQSRRSAAKAYCELLKECPYLILPQIPEQETAHVFHQFTLRVKEGLRDQLANYLTERKIPFGIYYPIPLHLQKAYADKNHQESAFKVTNQFSKEVISLPMHSELSQDQLSYICISVLNFFKSVN